ncbi:MAG: efflux RND transporter permease subunit [Planctomycetaceae bacterium]
MYTYLYNNPRILILSIVLIVVSGSLSAVAIPRMEDPQLTPRAATITTLLPGASAERVESMVTEKIEQKLKDIEEIKEISSVSRAGVSFIAIELQDTTTRSDAPQIWSRIRDKAADARNLLPPEATRPDFERLDIKAFSVIAALTWDADSEPRYGVLRRLASELKDEVDSLPGTEKSELVGDPAEEIVVELDPDIAASLNLQPRQISDLIQASDSRVAAGQLRGAADEMLVEIDEEIDSVSELASIPIQVGDRGNAIALSDIATIERSVRTPLSSKVLANGRPAVGVAIYVVSSTRLDYWRESLTPVFERFRNQLPPGISLNVVFDQNDFVNTRMKSLVSNLLFGIAAVFFTNLLVLGWRNTWVVSLGLPLSVLAVLAIMYFSDIPIHQMSITGLIISMGLVVDNAIVVVDEIQQRLQRGFSRIRAVEETCRHLASPLLGATLTTVISFAPIATMPGPSGEFVGSIATVAIAAVTISLVLALTIVATIAGYVLKPSAQSLPSQAESQRPGTVATWYRTQLRRIYSAPLLGILLATLFPILGFVIVPLLPLQFFPPADRNQFHIQLQLSGTESIQETEAAAQSLRQRLLQLPEIDRITWFLGESAPPFYYNIIPDRKNSSRFAQAIVDCSPTADLGRTLAAVQQLLDREFPGLSALALQLEQGPPFTAPIEVQLFGPDADVLRELGEQVRLVLTQTPHIIQTRSDFTDALPNVALSIDEDQARLAGLNHSEIARELNSMLEGVTGGSILEGNEELAIRVRVSDRDRSNVERMTSVDLVAPHLTAMSAAMAPDTQRLSEEFTGVPLSAISKVDLSLASEAITRYDGRRLNEIHAFISPGVLPAVVQADFEARLRQSGFRLPNGYRMNFAGAEAERNDAVGNLIVNGINLFFLMVAVLVISTRSFRLTAVLFSVALLAAGAGIASLAVTGMNWGFMSIVGIMGMIGIAVNDSIVVIASLQELPPDQVADADAVAECVSGNTRHIIATSLTTLAGFLPLFLNGGDFWPPVAVSISGGVLFATLVALLYVPCVYRMVCRRTSQQSATAIGEALSPESVQICPPLSTADNLSGNQNRVN